MLYHFFVDCFILLCVCVCEGVVERVGSTSVETEVLDIVLDKREGQSLGFTVCRGNGVIDGRYIKQS